MRAAKARESYGGRVWAGRVSKSFEVRRTGPSAEVDTRA